VNYLPASLTNIAIYTLCDLGNSVILRGAEIEKAISCWQRRADDSAFMILGKDDLMILPLMDTRQHWGEAIRQLRCSTVSQNNREVVYLNRESFVNGRTHES
jgi:hypothetical protein